MDRESLFDLIIDYEAGELSDEATVDLFQRLVDDGLIWHLQGHYGRMANDLAHVGLIENWPPAMNKEVRK